MTALYDYMYGGVMELVITCGSLALAHAGIEMF
eukprot:COSAG06_NODE_30553_length_537_cov_0.609589_1_plen_32_part_01